MFFTLVFFPIQLRTQLVVLHLLFYEPPQVLIPASPLTASVGQDTDNATDVIPKNMFTRCVRNNPNQSKEKSG